GDYGKMYSTYTKQMCQNMFRLVQKADIVTPNITEACILTNTSYKEKWTQKELLNLSKKICDLGPSKVVITGINQKTFVCNFCFQKDGSTKLIKTHKVGSSRSGTGDIFASIIACDAVNGIDFEESVKKASRFIKKCIEKAIEMEIPLTDGVPFEELLNLL
ncbi:MAG: PfkB family carbohydrate kinase, partial [Floccifex sp.]